MPFLYRDFPGKVQNKLILAEADHVLGPYARRQFAELMKEKAIWMLLFVMSEIHA